MYFAICKALFEKSSIAYVNSIVHNSMKKLIKYTNTIDFNVPVEYKHASGIYKIINTITNQIYVGRTKDFYARYLKHKESIKRGECNFKFKLLMLKHNDVHFIMELIEVTNDIINREEYYIKTLNSVTYGLNIVYNDMQQRSPTFRNDIKILPEYKEYLALLKHNKKSAIVELQKVKIEPKRSKINSKCKKLEVKVKSKKFKQKIKKKTISKELKRFKRLMTEIGYEAAASINGSSISFGKIKFKGKIVKMTKIRKVINYTITTNSDFSSSEVLEFIERLGLKIEINNNTYKFYIKNYTGKLRRVTKDQFVRECQLYEYDFT